MRHSHYTCDLCQRVLDSDDVRYVVHIEIGIDCDEEDDGGNIDDDRDHLQEVGDALEYLRQREDAPAMDEMKFRPYHLCVGCRERFLLDPLGRRLGQQLDFSNN